MLVVEPSGMRFEDESFDGAVDDEHLLERITALENGIARLSDRFSEILSLLLKQTRSDSLTRSMLETLFDSLAEVGAVESETVRKRWRSLEADGDDTNAGASEPDARSEILSNFRGRERERFRRLVSEGLERIEEGKRAAGVRRLERALELDERNAPLNYLLGAEMFRAGRAARAVERLKRALASRSFDERARLLLGLSCCDVGDAEAARELLSSSVENGASCFAAHYALGRLAVAESDWRGALSEFKKARARRKCPESHYLVGLAHFHLGHLLMARRQLEKAAEMDGGYAAAHHLLGVVRAGLGDSAGARASYRRAASLQRKTQASGKEASTFKKGEPPPFFQSGGRGRRRLLTGADPRLDEFVREEAHGNARLALTLPSRPL